MPTVLAALTFAGFVIAFVWEMFAYAEKVVGWARSDLQSRADLAAANLEEPLRTQNFSALHEFGAKCMADGYRLSVFDGNGRGRVYDTFQHPETDSPQYSADQRCGEYLVRLWIPVSRVLKPFFRALIGISLAGFIGVAGVVLFFFVTYRQRVRIRELKRLETFRREFISDVSHEIKTPLTGILGAIDLLQPTDPSTARLLPLIRKESVRLNALVQSVLDLARLEREGEVLNRAEADLCELAREIAAKYGFACAAEGSCRVSCDVTLLSQAVENLAVNAVRHSGTKDIAIAVGRSDREAFVSVEDHGIGIPPEHQERVFERFHRVDPARAAETGGAGLGLAIVRRIARLHGGDVTLTSAAPHGCRFVLSLPF